MHIIGKGTDPKFRVFGGTCGTCKTVVQFARAEGKLSVDARNGNNIAVERPVCLSNITVDPFLAREPPTSSAGAAAFLYPSVVVKDRTIFSANWVIGNGGAEIQCTECNVDCEDPQSYSYKERLAERLALAWNATRNLSDAKLWELSAAIPASNDIPPRTSIPSPRLSGQSE